MIFLFLGFSGEEATDSEVSKHQEALFYCMGDRAFTREAVASPSSETFKAACMWSRAACSGEALREQRAAPDDLQGSPPSSTIL